MRVLRQKDNKEGPKVGFMEDNSSSMKNHLHSELLSRVSSLHMLVEQLYGDIERGDFVPSERIVASSSWNTKIIRLERILEM